METNKIPILSFFSGGGFLDMGFEDAGFDIVWTNEHDNVIANFYAEGITTWKNYRGSTGYYKISNLSSIKDLSYETILSEAFLPKVPTLFGVIGGPPCQDFSQNGNLHGFKGDKGSLTDCFINKIIELEPSFFVMENVTGLIRVKKTKAHFLQLLKMMSEFYWIDFDVLNSLDFGVPQNRDRVFVVGLNKKQFDFTNVPISLDCKWFPFPKDERYFNALRRYKWPEASPFGKNPKKDCSIPSELCLNSCLVAKQDEDQIPNANEYFKLLGDKRKLSGIWEGETNRPSFKRLHRFKYSPTTCYGNNEVHLHPFYHRRLSVREALRIQGVPDSYILPKGNLSKKFKMIGNGVPVPLAKAIASSLRDFLQTVPLTKERNGYLVEGEEKRGDVQNPVKEHKAGKNIAVSFT
jgi:DNA (cytosine-5)-methyltransferase 1